MLLLIIGAAENRILSETGCLSLNVELSIDVLINSPEMAKL